MPELPDVQVFRERIDPHALDRRIETVSIREDRMLQVSPSTLRRHLLGAELTATRRHGKHLFVRIGEGERWLHLHFGMTGETRRWEAEDDEPDHQALRLDLEGEGHLAVLSTRKLGRIDLVDDPDVFVEEEGLGPDPLVGGFGPAKLRDVIEGRRGTIKGTLTNQEVLAGIGNIYADETLFQAGVHPETKTPELDEDTVEEIHRAMERVLERAIDARVRAEDMPKDFLLPHRDEGAECPKCGGTIRKVRVSGRSTYFCEDHQDR